MELKELKAAHAKIMRLIEKSNDGTASVMFRRFPHGDFMMDFHAENWYEWTGKDPTTVYTHNEPSKATELVNNVAAFLSRDKTDK